MPIAVTGATGQYGHHAVHALLRRGTPAHEVIATGRSAAKLTDFAELGVVVREADYNDPASLDAAFADADKLLFVSGSDVGQRLSQHRNVVDAAVRARITQIAYTSVVRADTSALLVAADHRATEAYIREVGIAFNFLRNSWYMENYTGLTDAYLAAGQVIGAAGDGRVSAATRADYAEAAAAVLTTPGHDGMVYELGGDTAFSMAEFAQTLSVASAKDIQYRDMSVSDYAAALVDLGFPAPMAEVFADGDAGVARGDLFVNNGKLAELIGHPTTTLRDVVQTAVAV